MAINVKWGGISGGVALILAVVTSLALAHTTLPVALLRGLIFFVLFCGLGIGLKMAIDTFFPELLSPGGESDMVSSVFSMEAPGSQINITVDDHTNVALPDSVHDSPEGEQVGDFADLASGGTISLIKDIDQSIESSYTDGEDFSPAFDDVQSDGGGGDFMDFGAFVSGDSVSSGAGDDTGAGAGAGTGELDSSDAMLDSFSFFPGDDDSGGGMGETSAPERRAASGNKPAKLEGDFDAKEIAQGLRTVLEKDKKG